MTKPSRQRAYGQNIPLIDVMPFPIYATRAPGDGDVEFEVGQLWIHASGDTRTVYIYSGLDSSGDAVWTLAAPGDSDVDTLTGDSGGAISPSGGTITLAGGTNVTSVGAGNTITFNLDNAITVATSVTTPLYTAGAGVDVAIDAPTGQDVLMTLGDNGGTNKFSILDSDSVEVFAVDSNGGQTFSSLTVAGALTQTAGVVSISEDNSANAVGIAGGTTARVVDLASSAAAHVLTIGSTTGAASTDIQYGTGNFTLDGGATGTITVGASMTSGTLTIGGTAQTGTMTLGDSSGTNIVQIGSGEGATTVNIAGGATSGKTVNIGTGAVANVVTIGSASGASSLDLLNGTGNFTLDGAATSTYTIGASTTTGTLTIGGTAQTGTMTLGDSSGTNTVQIGSGEGATTVNIAGGATNAKTVNVATGAVANLVTIGSASGAASLDLLAGTGNFTLDGAATTTYTVGASTTSGTITVGGTSQTGTMTLGSSDGTSTVAIAAGSGASTVAIAGGTGGNTVTIANGAGANAVTIGSTNTTSALTLQAGTGNITATGTFESLTTKQVINSGATLTFKASPTTCTAADTAGVATGATGAVNLLGFDQGVVMEQFIIGAGQTIIKPTMANAGLLCSLDLVTTEGVEYNFGAGRTTSPFAFTIGADGAFFFEVTMTIADLSGGNPYFIGFRKSEANNATYTSYTDYYAVGINATTSGTNVTAASELNGGGTTLQDTGTAWTGGDGGTTTLRVLVSAAGVVTATIDGGGPSTPLAYTFDDSDVVCPFIHIVHNADAGAIHLVDMSVGLQ